MWSLQLSNINGRWLGSQKGLLSSSLPRKQDIHLQWTLGYDHWYTQELLLKSISQPYTFRAGAYRVVPTFPDQASVWEVGSETQKYYRPHGIPYSTSTLVHSYHCFPKPLSTFPNGRIMDSSKRTRSELNTINNLCTINPAGPIFIAFFKSKSLITKMSCLFYGTNMLRDWKNV